MNKKICQIIDTPPQHGIHDFLHKCALLGGVDVGMIDFIAKASIDYYKGDKKKRGMLKASQVLQNRWYDSVRSGKPDYSVYADDWYIADLWACWVVYSRGYIKNIYSDNSMPDGSSIGRLFDPVDSVLDLGCGIGYTTSAFRQIYNAARIYGTNFPGLKQTEFAEMMSRKYDFSVYADSYNLGHVDLVFASEYFEHIPSPVDHLRRIIESNTPRYLIIANAFSAISIGHFPQYEYHGGYVDNKKIGRLFNQELRNFGYKKVNTKLWNNRPSIWIANR